MKVVFRRGENVSKHERPFPIRAVDFGRRFWVEQEVGLLLVHRVRMNRDSDSRNIEESDSEYKVRSIDCDSLCYIIISLSVL